MTDRLLRDTGLRQVGTMFDEKKGMEDARRVRSRQRSDTVRRIIMTRMHRMFIAGLLALSSAGTAQAESIVRNDFQVFQGVSRQVQQYVNFTVFDSVSASVDNGVVTLTGRVTMPYKVQDLTRRVARVDGVRHVDNRIQVLPVSRFDDELRLRIARAIYGNPSFWHYASMANPPIHIVVEQGRVKLEGTVNSHVERMLAQSLAIGFGEFSVENHLKTDAERLAELEQID